MEFVIDVHLVPTKLIETATKITILERMTAFKW